jgi:hypothetical protein
MTCLCVEKKTARYEKLGEGGVVSLWKAPLSGLSLQQRWVFIEG